MWLEQNNQLKWSGEARSLWLASLRAIEQASGTMAGEGLSCAIKDTIKAIHEGRCPPDSGYVNGIQGCLIKVIDDGMVVAYPYPVTAAMRHVVPMPVGMVRLVWTGGTVRAAVKDVALGEMTAEEMLEHAARL